MLPSIVFLSLLALISKLASVSAYSQELCTTKVGTKSIKPVPSTTYALTVTLTKIVQVTSTPVTTVTPKAVTTTVPTTTFVTVTTTAPTNTNTVTTTVTDTARSTITSTSTETDTETDTTTTTSNQAASTVPAPPGFTAIQQEPGYTPKVKAREALGLAARAVVPPQVIIKLSPNGKGAVISPQLYPTSVLCGELVETVTTKTTTSTAKTTSTSAAATPTSTVTSTITSTSTSTVFPAGVTFTATATVSTTYTTSINTTTTTTTTTSTTVTIFNDPTTSYAACAPSNIAAAANGGHSIDEVDGGSGNSASFVSVGSPYDCCVACITSTDNCRAFVYVGTSGLGCGLIIGNSCDPGIAFGGEQFRTDASDTSPGLPVGNGRCGILQNGGPQAM